MILLDGKNLAETIKEEVREEIAKAKRKLRLAIVVVGDNSITSAFIKQKQKCGESLGVKTRVYDFPADISTNKLRQEVSKIVHIAENNGIIVQLPLPEHIHTQNILNAVVPGKDIDVLSARAVGDLAVGTAKVFPPVVASIRLLVKEANVPDLKGLEVAVVGSGRLVGRPVSSWLISEGANVMVLNESASDLAYYTRRADILVSGAGVPGLIKGDMIKEDAIVIDAGTSESQGKLAGDVDLDSVSQKASAVSPVPGGVGPLTVAMIFKNLLELSKKK